MMRGTCALCRAPDPELQDSHLLPRFAYKRIRGGAELSNPDPVHFDSGRVHQTSRQLKAYLLCAPCEQRFGTAERYVSTLCYQGDGSIPIVQHFARTPDPTRLDVVIVNGLDCATLAYFASSIVWRADVMGENAKLGDRYRETLRRYLVGENPFPERLRAILLVLHGGTDVTRMDLVMTVPVTHRFERSHEHSFIMCGLEFTLLIGGCLPDNSEHICLVRGEPKRLLVAPPHESGLVRATIVTAARGRPSAALAAWTANRRRDAAG